MSQSTIPVLEKPYWIADGKLPGLDFNREIVEPGHQEMFPDGCVGIRVDDDFWAVAALPLKQYRTMAINDIVALFWPEYAEQATYAPDHGSHEQKIYFLNTEIENLKSNRKHQEEEVARLRDENQRLRKARPELLPHRESRFEMHTNYFIRQYEHLLIASAHHAVPLPAPQAGICSTCGLYTSNRVHLNKYIALREKGYKPDPDWAGNYTDEDLPDIPHLEFILAQSDNGSPSSEGE